ncbi:MAG: hypothetical protein HY833_00815 [Candidatus Aenigmarchaeota archaeon]|nr:hypothetical protein [Candidatus Aenigmarchaeota archaeon]
MTFGFSGGSGSTGADTTLYVDGTAVRTCRANSNCYCYSYCLSSNGCYQNTRCVCSNGPISSSCSATVQLSQGRHSYQVTWPYTALVRAPCSRSCGTVPATGSVSGSFSVGPPPVVCNGNGICDGTETQSICPAECGTCSSDGICALNEPLTCSDCGAGKCDKDSICEAGEAGKCPSDCPGNFSLTVSPSVGVANRGDLKDVNVSVNLTSGYGYPVLLSAAGTPNGTTSTFTPASCTPNCYSNMTVNTSSSTPIGSSIITVSGTSGSITRSGTYNLTVLPSTGLLACGNLACDYPETQSSCASDCSTTTSIPSPVTPGEVVAVSVEFYDFRYLADGNVKINLNLDGTTVWSAANGCSFGGVKLGPSSTGGATAWPSGTTSENGHFKIVTLCTIPSSLSAGSHTLVATPTIY